MPFIRYIAAAATIKSLQRTCPSCGKTQTIEQAKIRRSVACKYCKSTIPAKK